ncbi:MAG TPA: methylated-DNA--[protein]-cysteine S-methyltransferase [Gammaproteobacteria bacterium]|nr:methylated-DNA--[protein]-cysteine S-methyltransferase [Gammaproteobacteria bacterium]
MAIGQISLTIQPEMTAPILQAVPCVLDIYQALRRYSINPHYRYPTLFSHLGTPFQRKVWTYLQNILPGQTQTYGEIAEDLNSSARAVGLACRRNPLLILIPCHRATNQQHNEGYAGENTLAMKKIKRALLAHEQR